MAVAKNKLQDIYSSAVVRLTELEANQRQGLSQMYEKYQDTDEDARKDLSKNMSGKQELLAQEIESFIANSVARIQSSVDMQSSLTNNCLSRCTQNLAAAVRKFDEQLSRTKLRQDVLERDALDELSAQFSAFVEQSLMGFLQVQNEWSQRLRDKHADFRADLEQAIASGITGLRQYEHDLTSTVQSSAMENMARLRGTAEQADEQLRAKYQEQAERLQVKLEMLDAAFQKHHSTIMTNAEAQARQSGEELAIRLDKMYSGPAVGHADLVTKHKSALQTSFESGASVLSSLLEKTRGDVAKAAEERAVAIDVRAKEVRGQIGSDVEALMQKLNSSFEISSKLEQKLQKDNEEMSSKMRSDLSNMFESFKRSMDNALNRSVAELGRNSKRAGHELGAACKESQVSIGSIASNIKREVDTSMVQILGRIRQARKAAVEKVEQAAAAGASGAAVVHEEQSAPQPSALPQPETPQPLIPEHPMLEQPAPPSHETENKDIFSDAEIWGDMPQGYKDDSGSGEGA